MSTNPSQLFLLADHVKLSLLERQRAVSLGADSTKQDGHISRSLDTLRNGLSALQQQQRQLSSTNENTSALADQIKRLTQQFTELSSQFDGSDAPTTSPSTAATTTSNVNPSQKPSRNVRFSSTDPDPDPDAEERAARAALFPSTYTDDPTSTSSRYTDTPSPDQSALSNTQIHAQHKQVLADQDAQLDTLGQSIGRQRVLGLSMGEELDAQNEMLTDVEAGVDRHTNTLTGARKRLGVFARRAKDNWSWVTIAVLILILVLLVAVT